MFGKWFAQAYTGSMMGSGSHVFAVWGWVVANAGKDGVLEINPKLLAAVIGDDESRIRDALDYLQSPDSSSRTRAEDGRRIVHVDAFTYRIVNHEKYRAKLSADERREYQRRKQAEYRQARNCKQFTNVDKVYTEQSTESRVQSTEAAAAKAANKGAKEQIEQQRPVNASEKRRRLRRPQGSQEVPKTLQSRAQAILRDRAAAAWDNPANWQESEAVADAICDAMGLRRPRLGSLQEGSPLERLLQLFAAGYTAEELIALAEHMPEDEWFSDNFNSLGQLTLRVIDELQNRTKGRGGKTAELLRRMNEWKQASK